MKRSTTTWTLRQNQKIQWDTSVTVTIIVVGGIVSVPKSLEKFEIIDIRGRIEIIQTTGFLRSATEKNIRDLGRLAVT